MLKFRKEFPAFGFDAEMTIRTKPAAQISAQAENALHFAELPADQMYNRIYITWKRTVILPACPQTLKPIPTGFRLLIHPVTWSGSRNV